MKKLTKPLKWHGGKDYLASRIVALFPTKAVEREGGYLHYVEPYAGGLSVLLANDPEGISEAVNDKDRELTTFWHVLQNDVLFETFRREVEATPFSQIEWDDAAQEFGEDEPVACAINFFIRCRQSLAGRMDTFAPLSKTRTRRGMNEQASAWLNAVEGLPAVHARMKRVVILGPSEALGVIRSQDGPQTLFYLDAPYVHCTRSTTTEYGACEMSDMDHCNLLALCLTLKGRVLISGYRCEVYDTCLKDWERVDFSLPNNAASGKTKRRMTESVWKNY